MLSTFSTGLVLGLSIAAPVGPIGILCIRRTLTMGRWVGLVSGLGAATADALYGCIAGFGLTAIADFLTHQAVWLRLGGGLFLCYLGITTFFSKPSEELTVTPMAKTGWSATVSQARGLARSLLAAYSSTLVLTLTNPATILSFAAMFAGLGLMAGGQNFAESGTLVLGVFWGSAFWWLALSSAVSRLRHRVTLRSLRWLNRISGLVLLVFGGLALAVWR